MIMITVLAELDRVGCDFYADVHGDEVLPYNFISGMEGIPKWGPRLEALQKEFSAAYKKVNDALTVCELTCNVDYFLAKVGLCQFERMQCSSPK